MKLLAITALMCAGTQCLAAAATDDAGQQSAAQPVVERDPQLTAEQVNDALRGTADLQASKVVVSTHANTIVLTGEADSEAQAARALAVAEQAADGVRVSSQIDVRADGDAVDRQTVTLVREVEKALRDDPRTARLGIAVSIDDGQVIGLHGLVSSVENRRLAETVAGQVKGVKRVRSHLVVPGE